ncbi:uncharacterized protein CXorf38 homolog isoform X2 [Aplysia californica]|nr:uncharacterized protein CXorf38 homolog isoform X2 [Aplysia californica]XP_005109059.1 uncharacterized protein CXorf38 homolog isoform X2 [Aplysia californica]XP_035828459.1 uncharacterized protein CXorf38 homolog isoform X2 [Aplysia californica]
MGQLTSRQELISSEVSNPLMRNWLCANLAVREASNALARYVHLKISLMHKEMQKSVGDLPVCVFNCSKRESAWCSTCESWRSHILAACERNYKSHVNWSRLNSSQWSLNPYEVGRAFIPRAHRLYYKSAEFHEDFRFSLSFLENCEEVLVRRSLCERAWQWRGKVLRKKGIMRLGSQELESCISVLVSLVSVSELPERETTIDKLRSLMRDSDEEHEGCVVM